MSTIGKTDWPNLLADLEAKRVAIGQAIDILRTHFVGADSTEMPESPIARPPKKAAAKRDGRTDGATRRPVVSTVARSLPDSTDRGQAILAALKAHGPSSPGELAKHAKFGNIHQLRYHMNPLLKAGAIVATGNTGNRRISLPGRAKEHL